MKKISIALLLYFLILFILNACQASPEAEIKEAEDELVYDFDGYEYIIIGYQRFGRFEVGPNFEEENTFWGEQLYNRYRELEQKYNIKRKKMLK